MDLHGDETKYASEDRQDLVARLMGAQALAQFLLRAFEVFRAYGVDFTKLPEWQDTRELDRARTLKPHAAQSVMMTYFDRLDSALSAAIRRRQFKLHDSSTE